MNNLLFFIFVQIVGESLPISSSSHVYLLSRLTVLPTLPTFFDHFLHGPTFIILLIFFRKEVSLFYKFTAASSSSRKRLLKQFMHIMKVLMITTPLAAAGYGFINGPLEHFIHSYYPVLMLGGLIITMVSLYSLRYKKENYSKQSSCLTLYDATMLGCVQALALLPGISRFASTFVAAQWLGYSWKRSFQLSFLIELPLIVAAFFIKALPALIRYHNLAQLFTPATVVTIIGATIGGYLALHGSWVLASKKKLWLFCLYLLIPIGITLFFIAKR